MVRMVDVAAAVLIITAAFTGPALAAGGSPSSGGGGAAASSSGIGTSGGLAGGSQPIPGKREAVENGLRQKGAAPSPAQDQQELQTLNNISRQVAPTVPVPAPEVGH